MYFYHIYFINVMYILFLYSLIFRLRNIFTSTIWWPFVVNWTKRQLIQMYKSTQELKLTRLYEICYAEQLSPIIDKFNFYASKTQSKIYCYIA